MELSPSYLPNDHLLQRGKVQVGQGRVPQESLALYYEIHGCPNESAERRLVLVMGLNTSCFAWKRAVQHYSHPSRRTQVLVFDNRGVGFSDTPPSPRFYKTTELAKDAIDLLDALGWTSRIHLAGVSMGGMIAQHLCDMCPKRFSSLVLISTTPGRRPWQLPRLPTFKGLNMIFGLNLPPPVGPANVEDAMNWVASVLFPSTWLDEPCHIPGSRKTNRERIVQDLLKRREMGRAQEAAGAFGQMAAALTHSFSAEQCERLNESVQEILIVTGDEDNLVHPSGSSWLHEHIGSSKLVTFQNAGHALPEQCFKRLHDLMEATFSSAEDLTFSHGATTT